MSIKLTLVAKRYNSERMVLTLTNMFLKYGLLRRWQISFKDLRGRHYDYYFVTKPTRKQIRKLIKDIK